MPIPPDLTYMMGYTEKKAAQQEDMPTDRQEW